MKVKNINNRYFRFILLFSIIAFVVVAPLITLLLNSDTKKVIVPQVDVNPYEISSGDVITQEIVIDKGLKKVSLLVANGSRETNEGKIEISISQNNIVESQLFDISTIKDWSNIDLNINYSKFKSGAAIIKIKSLNTKLGKSVYFNFLKSDKLCDLPQAKLNGESIQGPLCITYEEYTNSADHQYRVTILIFIFISIFMLSYSMCKNTQDDSKEYVFIFTMILIAFIISFKYPTLTFKAEAWAESAVHFYKIASEESIIKNLIALEGGLYISLVSALVSIFSVKILSLGRNYILFIQLFSLIFASICCSIFCLKYFRKYFSDFSRVIFSLFIGVFLFDGDFNTFIGVSYLAIILIIGISLYNLEEISKTKYLFLCIFTAIICLSKMSYVTLFPTSIITLILFGNKLDKRKKNYFILISVFSFLEGILSLIIRKFNDISLIGGSNLGDISVPPVFELIEKTVYYFIQIMYSILIRKDNLNYPYIMNIFFLLILVFSVGLSVYWIHKKSKYDIYGKSILILYTLAFSQCGLSLISNASINSLDVINWNKNIIIYQNRHLMFSYIAMIFIFIIWGYILKDYISNNLISDISNKFINYAEIIVVVCVMVIYCNYYTLNSVSDFTNTELSHSDWKSYSKVLNNDSYCIRVAPEGGFLNRNSSIFSINNAINMYSDVNIDEVGDKSKGVIAIYANKYLYTNQLKNRKYIMTIYDSNNNKLAEVMQSNDEYRQYIGFIINEPIDNVAKVEFHYEDGEPAYLQNELYVAREV